ncbi:MAG: histidine phosphatase family protein [Acidimicrobiia bacterium]|nr:histidine phosphatase family protein [Acidimicrobiia bacterium]
MPVEITFIRHAQTTGNAGGRWQGHSNSALTELGEDQAARLGVRLGHIDFDLVVSSDLDRTMATAAVLGQPVEPDPRWREPFFGSWEDLTTGEIMAQDPELVAALFRGEDVAAPGGGERMSAVVERSKQALDDLVSRIGQGRVAVVSHGMALLLLMASILETKRPSPLRLLGNSSTATITFDGDDFSVEAYNDDTHLGHTALPHFGSSPEDTEMLLIRHGKTVANSEGRWQGHTDGVLNAEGRRQAELLSKSVPPLDVLYSSSLSRAAQTAAVIAESQSLQVHVDPRLKEIGFGAWEGMSPQQIALTFPDEYQMFRSGTDLPRGGDGETFAGVRQRMEDAIGSIVASNPGRTVGVVSHGGATRAYVTDVLGMPYEHRRRLSGLGNTCYARLAFTSRGPTVVSWNLGPHLT